MSRSVERDTSPGIRATSPAKLRRKVFGPPIFTRQPVCAPRATPEREPLFLSELEEPTKAQREPLSHPEFSVQTPWSSVVGHADLSPIFKREQDEEAVRGLGVTTPPPSRRAQQQSMLDLGPPPVSNGQRSSSTPHLRHARSSANVSTYPSTPQRNRTVSSSYGGRGSPYAYPQVGLATPPATPPRELGPSRSATRTPSKSSLGGAPSSTTPRRAVTRSPSRIELNTTLEYIPVPTAGPFYIGASQDRMPSVNFLPNADFRLVGFPPSVAQLAERLDLCEQFAGREPVQLQPIMSVHVYWPGYASGLNKDIQPEHGCIMKSDLLHAVAYQVSLFLTMTGVMHSVDENWKKFKIYNTQLKRPRDFGIRAEDVVIAKLVHRGGIHWFPELALLPRQYTRAHLRS